MAINVEITEYEVDVENYSPETTKPGQVVVYFRSNSEAETQKTIGKLKALIFRTQITLQSDGIQVIIYTDGLVETKIESGITFINLCEE